MTELKKMLELNALICEAQAIAIEVDAMKVANKEAELKHEYPIYREADFMRLAQAVSAITEQFRKLEGVR